jgi:xanthine dehydrogenase accessory factor
VALASEAFYIGSLGSKRTHAKRLDRLRAQGQDEVLLARIHGPVGLDIGAKSPSEIAVSIIAQVTQALHRTQ